MSKLQVSTLSNSKAPLNEAKKIYENDHTVKVSAYTLLGESKAHTATARQAEDKELANLINKQSGYLFSLPPEKKKTKKVGGQKKAEKLCLFDELKSTDGVGWDGIFSHDLDDEYYPISDLAIRYANAIVSHLRKTRKEPKNELSFWFELRADVTIIAKDLDGMQILYIDEIKLYPNGHDGGKYRSSEREWGDRIDHFFDIAHGVCVDFLENAVEQEKEEFRAKLTAQAA